jgi:outer membrane lipoprotein-sorting protein
MVPLRSNLALVNKTYRRPYLKFALLANVAVAFCTHAANAPADPLLQSWLAAQTNLHTWSAEFSQTRTLKALATPLTAQGQVWFAAPDRFRWELGNPAQTLAIREPTQMVVIYPKLKRAERYSFEGKQQGPWRDVLALLEAGFPRSKADLDQKFQIAGHTVNSNQVELTLVPRASAARKMMPQIKIGFETNQFTLRSTELQFADGSRLRNEFTATKINPQFDLKLFEATIPSTFEVIEPLKR